MIRAIATILVLGVPAMSAPAAPSPYRIAVEVTPAQSRGLDRVLTVTITDAQGAPVAGAVVDVTVDMPSMPMTHRVPKARALAGTAPGSYVARISFEMRGEWAATVDVAAPTRMSVVRKFMIR